MRWPFANRRRAPARQPPSTHWRKKGGESAHARHGGGADVGAVSTARPWGQAPFFPTLSRFPPSRHRLSSQSLAASRFHERVSVVGGTDAQTGARGQASVERRSGWFFFFGQFCLRVTACTWISWCDEETRPCEFENCGRQAVSFDSLARSVEFQRPLLLLFSRER